MASGGAGGAAAQSDKGASATASEGSGAGLQNVSVDASVLRASEGDGHTNRIAELIEHHRDDIDALAERVKDVMPPDRTDGVWFAYDDISLLRYILSFGSAEAAEAPLRECIRFRALPEHQARAALVRRGEALLREDERFKLMSRFQVAGPIDGAQKDGGLLIAIRAGMCDNAAVRRHLSMEEQFEVFLLFRELGYWKVDTVARRDGILAKQNLVMDMEGVSMSDMMDRSHSVVQQRIGAISAVVYPQLLGRFHLVNPPSWIALVFRLFRNVTPKRLTEKMRVWSSAEEMWSDEEAAGTFTRSQMPAFLGGERPDSELPPALTGELLDPTADHLDEIVVPNRSKREVRVTVPVAGARVRYTFSVATHGVSVEALFLHGDGDGHEAAERPTGESTVLRAGGVDKVKADNGTVKGEWLCPAPGVLVVTFDNSYSILRSKTVSYSFKVDIPDDGAEEGAADGAAESTGAGEAAPGRDVGAEAAAAGPAAGGDADDAVAAADVVVSTEGTGE